MNPIERWAVVAGFATVVAAAVAVQHRKVELLQDQAGLWHEQDRERRQLVAANQALKARQPLPEQIAALGQTRAETERLRRELPALRERLDALLHPPPANEGPQPPLAAGAARNVGRATPGATIETALWAVGEGDLDTLAGALVLGAEARARAAALFAGLPEQSRAIYGTPEKLVALMAAKDVPLGGLQIMGLTRRGENEVQLRLRLQDERRQSRAANLSLRSSEDGWKLVVPESAVARYAEQLKGPGGK